MLAEGPDGTTVNREAAESYSGALQRNLLSSRLRLRRLSSGILFSGGSCFGTTEIKMSEAEQSQHKLAVRQSIRVFHL